MIKMTTTMMIFQHDVKDDPIVDSHRRLEHNHEQYHPQQAQLRTRPTKASAGGGVHSPPLQRNHRGGAGKGTTTGPTPQGGGGDTMGWGGEGGCGSPASYMVLLRTPLLITSSNILIHETGRCAEADKRDSSSAASDNETRLPLMLTSLLLLILLLSSCTLHSCVGTSRVIKFLLAPTTRRGNAQVSRGLWSDGTCAQSYLFRSIRMQRSDRGALPKHQPILTSDSIMPCGFSRKQEQWACWPSLLQAIILRCETVIFPEPAPEREPCTEHQGRPSDIFVQKVLQHNDQVPETAEGSLLQPAHARRRCLPPSRRAVHPSNKPMSAANWKNQCN